MSQGPRPARPRSRPGDPRASGRRPGGATWQVLGHRGPVSLPPGRRTRSTWRARRPRSLLGNGSPPPHAPRPPARSRPPTRCQPPGSQSAQHRGHCCQGRRTRALTRGPGRSCTATLRKVCVCGPRAAHPGAWLPPAGLPQTGLPPAQLLRAGLPPAGLPQAGLPRQPAHQQNPQAPPQSPQAPAATAPSILPRRPPGPPGVSLCSWLTPPFAWFACFRYRSGPEAFSSATLLLTWVSLKHRRAGNRGHACASNKRGHRYSGRCF